MSGHPLEQQATIDTAIQNYNNSPIAARSGETMQEITTDPAKITVSFRTNDTQESRNPTIWRVYTKDFEEREHNGKVYDGVYPIDSEGNPTDEVDKYMYIPPYIVAEKLNSYINPARAGQYQGDFLTAYGSGFRFTASDDPSFYGKTTTHGGKERVVPADINMSEIVLQDGVSAAGKSIDAITDLTAISNLSQAKSWAEKTLQNTLGQIGYFDAEVKFNTIKDSWPNRKKKGSVEIEVIKEDGTKYKASLPWEKGDNRLEFAKGVEDFYNALLNELRAEQNMVDPKGNVYRKPDMTKYGAPQENDSKTFDPNKY